MQKPSKRRRHKKHGKAKKPSKHDRRKSKSPASKRKDKNGQPLKPSKEEATSVVVKKKVPRRTRRNDWRWKMKKKGKRKKGYTTQDWYWGMISQSEAEEYLKDAQDGEFLVRSMIFQETTALILTVVSFSSSIRKFHHFQASIQGSRWQLETFPPLHKTIVELIKHYHQNFIGFTGLKLKIGSKQPNWFIKSHKIMCPKNSVVLGSGNFSAVLIGAFRRRLVAVKILTSQGDRLLMDREAMMKEATLMSKLQHPYITKMVGVSIDRMPPMLLVEMMATSLISHIEKYGKYTTIGEKLLYCWQLASGLAFMAKQGIVHRDIAARNALFNRYGILKLSDFGLSDFEIKLTAITTLKENLPIKWMCPEAIGVKSVSATFNEKTDVWMFGVACTEIFNDGAVPLGTVPTNELKNKILDYKDGDVLYTFSKYTPEDIQNYFKKLWKVKAAERPCFEEIKTVFDAWLKMRYPPPPLEKRTVQMIPNCNPLTIAEYEILYANNCDWLPAVRKVKIKKMKKEATSKKSGSEAMTNPRQKLRNLRRKLINKRKRNLLRIKLRWWRERRREEKKRVKILINYDKMCKQRTNQRSNGYKQTLEKHEKLVDLYWKLMMVKWRKRAPNRKTRLRLRRHRLINKMSKHPISRNMKVNRISLNKRQKMRKTDQKKTLKPTFPPVPKFIVKKKGKKKKASINGSSPDVSKSPTKGTFSQLDPVTLEQIKEKKKRKIRKRKRHQLRKRNKRKHRKKRHGKRRQRRRQKLRRRHRKQKKELRRDALTIDQKERIRDLTKRRDQKKKLENRLKRDERIGKILKDWIAIRRFFIFRRRDKVLKRLAEKQRKKRKQKSKEPKAKEKTARTGRRKSKSKSRT